MAAHIIERVHQLARSGKCRTMDDLHKALSREGYIQIHEHLAGRLIKAQLAKLMADARP